MNIFYVDEDPNIAASYLVDRHILKMGIESVQMLCTAHRLLDDDQSEKLYKATHANHPSNKWVRHRFLHYVWLKSHARAIFDIYSKKSGKVHKTSLTLDYLDSIGAPYNLDYSEQFFAPPLCMPDKYKQEDPVESYREFYNYEKEHLHKWTYNERPLWINRVLVAQ